MTLELTAKVTVILCLVVAGSLLLRRSSAAARHRLQVLGLCSVLILPAAAVALPVWEIPVLSPDQPQEAGLPDEAPHVTAATSGEDARPQPRAMDRKDCPCDEALQGVPYRVQQERPPQVAALPAAVEPPSRPLDLARLGGGLWLLGAALVLGRLAFHWMRMTSRAIEASPLDDRRIMQRVIEAACRLELRRLPRVLVSRRIEVPVLWGFLRPTLMLPETVQTWSNDRLRVVLLHELAHLRRGDGAALLLGRLAAAAWWFHPMVWIVERWTRRDCERACDDAVLAAGELPSSYAEHLLQIARELPAAPAGALAVTGSAGPLEHRVRSILHPDAPRGLGRRGALVALCAVSLLLTSVASAKLVAREPFAEPAAEPAEEAQWVHSTEPGGEEYLLAHDRHEDDSEGEATFRKAYDLHRDEQWEQASTMFEKAADLGYREGTALYNAACGQARLGRTGDALELIERAFDAGFDGYKYLLKDDDLDPIRSEPRFRALLDSLEDDAAFGRRPARDRYQEAIEQYEDLVDERSGEAGRWYKVGSDLLRLREFERGVDALERAAELQQRNQNALYNLACAHALQGNTREALDLLERSVLAGFDSEERFRNDSDLDSIRDERRFAEIEQLHDTLSLDRFRSSWNGSNYSSRRWAPAIEEFEHFVRERPDVGRGWFNLGWALHFSRRHGEAREAFERQRGLGYRPAIATYNIACTYAMQGDAEQALDWLERAVETGSFGAHQLVSDEDLETLREAPRFEELVERAQELNEEDGWSIRTKIKEKLERKQRSRQY